MVIRCCKIALLIAAGLYLGLIAVNNAALDYPSNYEFVRHVMLMDSLFSGNTQAWRAIRAPWLHHCAYWAIIAWEGASSYLILAGAWKLLRAARASAASFNAAKGLAACGLTLSLLQWVVAFLTVGGEWFLMWQSAAWNGQEAALRMFAIFGTTLVFVSARDSEIPRQTITAEK